MPDTVKTPKKNDGGPAFPETRYVNNDGVPIHCPGMSLRDWFAGQALQGMLSGTHAADLDASLVASDAYWYADAMLAAMENTHA